MLDEAIRFRFPTNPLPLYDHAIPRPRSRSFSPTWWTRVEGRYDEAIAWLIGSRCGLLSPAISSCVTLAPALAVTAHRVTDCLSASRIG
jgi:hypothetical protein